MITTPIIEAKELLALAGSDGLLLIHAGGGEDYKKKYDAEHLDGALYLDLGEHLSDIKSDYASGGRHPLPNVKNFISLLLNLGINKSKHIVVYDYDNAANAAARLWWMLLAIGHDKVQVLNGGFDAAKKNGFLVNDGIVQIKKTIDTQFDYADLDSWLLPISTIDEVAIASKDETYNIVDVRQKERYNGEFEPIDEIAGHIPRAINIPFTDNLNEQGYFRKPSQLGNLYHQIFQNIPINKIIVHCGSGVTACHTLLAMAHAGYELPKVYMGSWSEWSRNNKEMITK